MSYFTEAGVCCATSGRYFNGQNDVCSVPRAKEYKINKELSAIYFSKSFPTRRQITNVFHSGRSNSAI